MFLATGPVTTLMNSRPSTRSIVSISITVDWNAMSIAAVICGISPRVCLCSMVGAIPASWALRGELIAPPGTLYPFLSQGCTEASLLSACLVIHAFAVGIRSSIDSTNASIKPAAKAFSGTSRWLFKIISKDFSTPINFVNRTTPPPAG